MKNCLHCNIEFEPKVPKAIYCSDKCRTYANRKSKKITPKEINWIIDKKGVRHPLNKSVLLNILEQMEGNILNPNLVPKKAQANDFVGKKTSAKIEEIPMVNVKVDYQKEFNECEFPDEYKKLWERIKNDPDVPEKEKPIWKLRLNAK